MAVNLELKIRVNSISIIVRKLKSINAVYKGLLMQKDVYYSYDKGLLKLRIENGKYTLIKYLRDEKGKDRFSNYDYLKFSYGNAENFLKEILKIEAVVQKKRLLYMYDNTRIHLDTVKGLGYFLELETLVINGKNDAKKRFAFIKEALELNELAEIKKSYRDLIIASKKSK